MSVASMRARAFAKIGSSSGGSTSGIIGGISPRLPKFCGPSGSNSISSTATTTSVSPDDFASAIARSSAALRSVGVVEPDHDRSGHDESIAVPARLRWHCHRNRAGNESEC